MSKNLRGLIVRLVVTLTAVGVVFFIGLAVNSYLDPFDDQPFVFTPDGAHLVYEGEIEGAMHPVVDELVGPAIPVGVPIFPADGSIVFIGLRDPDGAQQTRQICRVTYTAHSSQAPA